MKFLNYPLSKMNFFAPPQGTIGIFVTIITFNGKVSFGLSTDNTVVSGQDADKIVKVYIEDYLRELANESKEKNVNLTLNPLN